MTKKIERYLLVAILGFAFITRLLWIDRSPPSLYIDEIDVGYQAHSLLKTGKDYFGNTLPPAIHSFADHRAPLLIYLDIPFVATLGLNTLSVRLPSIIFGTLSILVFFFLLKEIFKKSSIPLLGAFIFSLTPWHFHYSRIAFEPSLLILLFITGLLFSIKSLKDRKYLILTAISWSLSLFAYNTAKLFIPLIGVIWLITYRKQVFKVKDNHLISSAVIVILTTTLIIFSLISQRGGMRFNEIAIYTDPTTKFAVNQLREESSSAKAGGKKLGLTPSILDKALYNKPMIWIDQFSDNYLNAYSFNFLFKSGDPNPRHSLANWGQLYKITFPFLVIGVIALGRSKLKRGLKTLLISWLLLAPIASSLTRDGGNHATRLFFLLPILVLIISQGIHVAAHWFKPFYRKPFYITVIGLLLLSFGAFTHDYFYLYPQKSQDDWMYGFDKAAKLAHEQRKNFDVVVLDAHVTPPLIGYLFYNEIEPAEIISLHPLPVKKLENDIAGFELENVFMTSPGQRNWRQLAPFSGDVNALLIIHASQLDENLLEHPKSLPPNSTLQEIIYDLKGNPVYYVLKFVSVAPRPKS